MKSVTYAIAYAILLMGAFGSLTIAQDAGVIREQRAIGFVKAVQAGDIDELLSYMHDNWAPARPGSSRESQWPRVAKSLIERHRELWLRRSSL